MGCYADAGEGKGMLGRILSKKELRSLIIYGVVGGLATIVEWTLFYVFNSMAGIQYMPATAIAFFFSTFANWMFGRLLLFEKQEGKSLLKELVQIYATSVTGLICNLVIMYVLVSRLNVIEMYAKMMATVIVFTFNYLVRRKLIYKKKN